MDICIGGPWNGSKVLKNQIYGKNSFKIKDKNTTILTTYARRLVSIEKIKYVFWISTSITDSEAIELIKKYINRKDKLHF